jgi:outer membrane protein assembly factor BamD (BamD/ComL family)
VRKIILLIVIICLSGCTTTTKVMTEKVMTEPEKQFQDAAVSAKEKRYKEAAACYNKIVTDSPDSYLAADALFELALLNAHHDNPQRDYTRASRSFAEFLKRYPDNRRADEARTWISVLRTVQELKKQNEHLNESIEELKQLDIRHEEKRIGK